MKVNAYAAKTAKKPLEPLQIERRDLKPNDVLIDIKFCGICHSDVHQARDEWGKGSFPMVPGHEITGIVEKVGTSVKKFKLGERVGVGCFVDSCRECKSCAEGVEQFCEKKLVVTYNGTDKENNPTYGGYSQKIVVDENYILTIPENLSLEAAAPLMCAGITTYSPLKYWKIKPGDKVGVMGLGGLGHMAVKLAAAMGAEVTVFSTSDKKATDAKRLGATHFVNTKSQSLDSLANTFNLLINTISAKIDLEAYLKLLKRDATMVIVGVPEEPLELKPSPLIFKRANIAGSLIGGIKETQEMLNFCGKHAIASDIELIPANKINEAYDRMVKGDVRYRFVVDIATLA